MLCTEKKGIFDCTKLSLVTSRGKTKRKNTISQVFFNKQYFNALHTTMQLEFPKPIRIVKEWIRILLFQNILDRGGVELNRTNFELIFIEFFSSIQLQIFESNRTNFKRIPISENLVPL